MDEKGAFWGHDVGKGDPGLIVLQPCHKVDACRTFSTSMTLEAGLAKMCTAAGLGIAVSKYISRLRNIIRAAIAAMAAMAAMKHRLTKSH